MKLLLCLTVIFIIGCGDGRKPPEASVSVESVHVEGNWHVTLEGEFNDSTAYGGQRRIYRFRYADGTEFIGVSGVGISEVGQHTNNGGKTHTQDER